MVSTSDKGAVTLLSNKSDYKSKMRTLIDDPANFSELQSDPTSKCQAKNNRLVTALFKQQHISSFEKSRLRTYTAVAPRIYGQLKYHKAGLPLRPIVSTIGSPAYGLSRYVASILRRAFQYPIYNVKNSSQFVRRAKNVQPKHNNVLVSFDVVNCFGNIPTQLAISLIERDFECVAKQTTIPKAQFMNLLQFCLNEANYFCYDGRFYQQIMGMFMGSSLAPILVERVIEETVNFTLERLHFQPDFWWVYVDDHITSIPLAEVNNVLTILNSYNEHVQFTVEIQDEVTKSINYLDVTVANQGGKLKTKWFSKPISSNRLLNFYSAHPQSMIANTAIAFIKRVLALSHKDYHADNIATVNRILVKNGFPANKIPHMIDRAMHNKKRNANANEDSYPFLTESTINTTAPITQSTFNEEIGACPPPPSQLLEVEKMFGSITYVPRVADAMGRLIRDAIPNLILANKPAMPLRSVFTNMKQKVEKGDQSGVVYRVNCMRCSKCYIGETKQKLDVRMSQHKNQANHANPKQPTALTQHTKSMDHQFAFESVQIVHKERIKRRLQIQETHHIILNEKDACNFKSDSADITPLYYNLIQASIRQTPQPANISHIPSQLYDEPYG